MSRTSLAVVALAAVAAAGAPACVAAHGVDAEVDQREGAVAVRVRYHGGRPLAGARYEVQPPHGGEAPFAEGVTDRHGWLAFTPDAPGKWTVRIADATGHGRMVEVEVAAAPAAPEAAAAPSAIPPLPGPLPARSGGRGEEPGDATVGTLRALAGAAAIAAVFVALFAVQRVRRRKGG